MQKCVMLSMFSSEGCSLFHNTKTQNFYLPAFLSPNLSRTFKKVILGTWRFETILWDMYKQNSYFRARDLAQW